MIFNVFLTYLYYLGSRWEIIGPHEVRSYSGDETDRSAVRGASPKSIIAEKQVLHFPF